MFEKFHYLYKQLSSYFLIPQGEPNKYLTKLISIPAKPDKRKKLGTTIIIALIVARLPNMYQRVAPI